MRNFQINLYAVVFLLCSCSQSDFSGTADKAKKDNGASTKGDSGEDHDLESSESNPSAEKLKNIVNAGTDDSISQLDDCIQLPAGGGTLTSKTSGSSVKNAIFHRSVAVDPGNTNQDPAPGYPSYKPYPRSAPTELASTVFELSTAALKGMIKSNIKEIEYIAFAHQFKSGLDKITISLHTEAKELRDVSSTNIYSAYGYLSVKNLQEKDGKVIGDVDIFSFNFDPNGSGPLHNKIAAIPSPQDGTDIVGPASEATTPKVSQKGLVLDKFKVTIEIGADLYDSVQYRAVRANLWTESPLIGIDTCK